MSLSQLQPGAATALKCAASLRLAMATVLVTGALGTVGRWTVDRFATEYDVVGVDLERPEDPRWDVDYRAADLTDPGAAWELVATVEPDAVVHLAAIPSPHERTGAETFRTNATAAYNVLTAAGEHGVPAVWTSSVCVYGLVFVEEPRVPAYLPIDTDHPTEPEDSYGVSKLAAEEVATAVARRTEVPVTTVRPAWVQEPGAYETAGDRDRFETEAPRPDGDFWSYLDVRDLVGLLRRVVEASLDGDASGYAVYNAAAPDSYLETPTREAIETAFGELPEDCALEGTESVYDTSGAECDLGWTAEHDWRTAETESVPEPEL